MHMFVDWNWILRPLADAGLKGAPLSIVYVVARSGPFVEGHRRSDPHCALPAIPGLPCSLVHAVCSSYARSLN
jgi:hypothetical protein